MAGTTVCQPLPQAKIEPSDKSASTCLVPAASLTTKALGSPGGMACSGASFHATTAPSLRRAKNPVSPASSSTYVTPAGSGGGVHVQEPQVTIVPSLKSALDAVLARSRSIGTTPGGSAGGKPYGVPHSTIAPSLRSAPERYAFAATCVYTRPGGSRGTSHCPTSFAPPACTEPSAESSSTCRSPAKLVYPIPPLEGTLRSNLYLLPAWTSSPSLRIATVW